LSSSLLSKYIKIKTYRTVILRVVVFEREIWSLTLTEEYRLRVFVLRRTCGSKRDEVTGEWRRQHNEELSDLYCLPNIFRVIKWRRMSWARHIACVGESKDVYRVLVGKLEGERPLGRPRRGWEGNTEMDLQEVGCGGMDWIELA